MPPKKKQVVHGSKRPRAASVETERRTKKKNDVQPASRRISFANRPIITGRKVDFKFMDEEHFRIAEWIRNQGWEKVFSLDVPVYPMLVREFFENIRIGTNSIESTVKGTLIVLDDRRISNCLDVPRAGICIPKIIDREECLRCILETDDVSDISFIQANQLSVEMRLLHHIISTIIFPKSGRFDWLTERDMAVMGCLIQGTHLNLAFIIKEQIKDIAKRVKASLPYGMIFTLFFRDCSVSLEGEFSKKLLHSDCYNERSLHRMGFKKLNDSWVKKGLEQEPTQAEEEEEEEEEALGGAEPSTPPAAAPPSTPPSAAAEIPFTPSGPSQVSIDTILEKVSEMFSELKKDVSEKFEELKASVELKGNELKDLMSNQIRDVRQELSYIDARIDDVLLNQKNVDADLKFTGAFTHEAARLSDRINTAILSQQGSMQSISESVTRLESAVGILMARMTPSQSFPTAPQPTPIPTSVPTPRPSSVKPEPSSPTAQSYSRRHNL